MGKLIIASHHDLASVPTLFDQVILLNGELIAAGPVAQVFTDANLHKTYHTAPFAGPAHGHGHGHAHHHSH
jgi:ABC-type Mn2+/Zn2+ transport system ATPase subunit